MERGRYCNEDLQKSVQLVPKKTKRLLPKSLDSILVDVSYSFANPEGKRAGREEKVGNQKEGIAQTFRRAFKLSV